eukprot:TRINITY_DN23507_c0_g1_i1.p2 TRINITY_DN23507_c0_g1~~TRINITY_DN23507_c0_g1_i1.p2  ORF type:complete len:105 (+),score=27.06 TRINITY_DN23507_c0_g1_i1:72-386(+)
MCIRDRSKVSRCDAPWATSWLQPGEDSFNEQVNAIQVALWGRRQGWTPEEKLLIQRKYNKLNEHQAFSLKGMELYSQHGVELCPRGRSSACYVPKSYFLSLIHI